MIATIQLIIKIGAILWEIEPQLYKAFMAIVAALHPTAEPVTAIESVKATAKAMIPKDNTAAHEVFDAAVAELDAYMAENPEYYGY